MGIEIPNLASQWNRKEGLFAGPGNGGGGGSSGSNSNGYSFDPTMVNNNLNTGYLDQLRGMASEDPMSGQWMQGQMEAERIRQAGDLDALQSQGASSLATQQGQMAMRGGLTSGATERLGSQNMMAALQGRSNLARGAAGREAQLRSYGDQRQRDLVGQLGQAELGAAGYGSRIDQYNAAAKDQAARDAMMSQAIASQGAGQGGDGSPWGSMMSGLPGGDFLTQDIGGTGIQAGDLMGGPVYTQGRSIVNGLGGGGGGGGGWF